MALFLFGLSLSFDRLRTLDILPFALSLSKGLTSDHPELVEGQAQCERLLGRDR
jgi:hypothetical protein